MNHHVPLSPHERRILGLVAEGLSNRGIADRLRITVESVESAISRLNFKVTGDPDPRIDRRVTLAVWWLRGPAQHPAPAEYATTSGGAR